MDPFSLFRASRPSLPFKQIDDVWYYKSHPSKQDWLPLERDGHYQMIKKCVEERARSQTPLLFSCKCGVCQSYLLQTLISKPEPVSSINLSVPATVTNPFENPFNDVPETAPVQKTLKFGKHAGKTFEEAYKDKKYCLWCIESLVKEKEAGRPSSPGFIEFVTYVKNRFLESS